MVFDGFGGLWWLLVAIGFFSGGFLSFFAAFGGF